MKEMTLNDTATWVDLEDQDLFSSHRLFLHYAQQRLSRRARNSSMQVMISKLNWLCN